MSPDLHPEELLDRAAAQTLSPQERITLDAHLAACAVCRFELGARADFAQANVPDLDIDNLVTIALAGSAQAQQGAPARVLASRAAARRRGMLVAAAAASLALSSYAAVASFTGAWLPPVVAKWLAPEVAAPVGPAQRRGTDAQPREVPAPVSAVLADPSEVPESVSAVLADPSEVPAPVSAVLLEPRDGPAAVSARLAVDPEAAVTPRAEVEPMPEPVRAVESAARRASAPPPAVRLEPVRQEAPRAVETAHVIQTPDIPAPLAPPAATLFTQANDARAHGDRRAALALFVQLRSAYPTSIEATLSRATVGRLLLDDGAAESALRELDGYLAVGDDALREEALAARAVALGKLSRASDEAAAWRALLTEFPDSLQAARARQRLDALVTP